MQTPSSASDNTRRMLPGIALVGVFLLPILGTALLQWHPDWIPRARTNHGDLLRPTAALPNLQLLDGRGQPATPHILKGKWNLLWFARGQCGSHCENIAAELQQIRLALGKDTDRVRPVAFIFDDAVARQVHAKMATLPAGHAYTVMADRRRSILELAQAPQTSDCLYIADPAGQLVLRYALDAPAAGILKDLERLLKYSWVG